MLGLTREPGGRLLTWKSQTAGYSESALAWSPGIPDPQMAGSANHLRFPSYRAPLKSQNRSPAVSKVPEASPKTSKLVSFLLHSSPQALALRRLLFRIPSFFSDAGNREPASVGFLRTAARPQGEGTLGQLSVKRRAVLASEKVVLTLHGLCGCRGKGRVLKWW